MAQKKSGTAGNRPAASARAGGRSGRALIIAGMAVGAIVIVTIFFSASLWALNRFFPQNGNVTTPKLAALPPLPPLTRSSYVTAPVAITLTAIRSALESAAPRDLVGKNENPVSSLLSKADMGVTVSRGAMAVTGHPEGLTIGTPFSGSLRLTGQIATQAGNLTGAVTGLLDNGVGKQVKGLTSRVLDQRADIQGTVLVTAHPQLTPAWRLEPNLSSQVALAQGAITIAGIKINVGADVKPMIDREVNAQVAALQSRLRNNPIIEQTLRREWTKMCRSIPLGGGNTGLPPLWLELRPTRAASAQPKTDGNNFTLTVGVLAETRIVPTRTTPDCPFPAQLEIVPSLDQGQLLVGLPIDLPFTEINKLLEAKLKGRHFPEAANAPVDAEVHSARIDASGDRLLISLKVKAVEKKSWFKFGADATIRIWGKPVLDRDTQIVRLTDLSIAVDSDAAYGLLSAAAQAAEPYLEDALRENAVIDLKPFAADALTKIGGAIADFREVTPGVNVDAAIKDLRLTGIEFDSSTLRVIAEAKGTVNVTVSQLPKM
ncbi:MAG: DUF4403 family protein [Pseudolabrys sp.]